jgi:hypothetical protein
VASQHRFSGGARASVFLHLTEGCRLRRAPCHASALPHGTWCFVGCGAPACRACDDGARTLASLRWTAAVSRWPRVSFHVRQQRGQHRGGCCAHSTGIPCTVTAMALIANHLLPHAVPWPISLCRDPARSRTTHTGPRVCQAAGSLLQVCMGRACVSTAGLRKPSVDDCRTGWG